MIRWLAQIAISIAIRKVYGATASEAGALAPEALRLLGDILGFHRKAKALGKSDKEAAEEAIAIAWQGNDPAARPVTEDDRLKSEHNPAG